MAGSRAGSGSAGATAAGGADAAVDVGLTPLGDGSAPDEPAASGARLVVVGYAGRRIASDDGMTWTEAPLVTKPPWGNGATLMPIDGDNEWLLRGVCYGNGMFVAVGGNGTEGMVLTSTDGHTWNVNPQNMPNDGCAYGNGVFATERRYSSDGENWQPVLKPPKGNRVIKFYQGKFVAVGDGMGNVSYSTDGKSWTELPIAYVGVAGEDKGYRDLAVGDGHFYAMKSCCGRTDYQFFEWDGVSDTSFTETPLSSIVGTTDQPNGIVYGGGHLLLEGGGYFYDRPDSSKTWTRHTIQPVKDAAGHQQYALLDFASYSNGMFSSPLAWTTDLMTFKSTVLNNDLWTAAASEPGWVRAVARP